MSRNFVRTGNLEGELWIFMDFIQERNFRPMSF
jgi:hypothetical protein